LEGEFSTLKQQGELMKKRHTEEQIITILREAKSGAVPVKALCKRHNISEQTFFRWRNKFGGMESLVPQP